MSTSSLSSHIVLPRPLLRVDLRESSSEPPISAFADYVDALSGPPLRSQLDPHFSATCASIGYIGPGLYAFGSVWSIICEEGTNMVVLNGHL